LSLPVCVDLPACGVSAFLHEREYEVVGGHRVTCTAAAPSLGLRRADTMNAGSDEVAYLGECLFDPGDSFDVGLALFDERLNTGGDVGWHSGPFLPLFWKRSGTK